MLVVPAFARDNFDKSAWELRDKRVFRIESASSRRLRPDRRGRNGGTRARGRRLADPPPLPVRGRSLRGVSTRGPPPRRGDDEPRSGGRGSPPGKARRSTDSGSPHPASLPNSISPDLKRPPFRVPSISGARAGTPPGVFAPAGIGSPDLRPPGISLRRAARGVRRTVWAGVRSLRLFRFAAFRAVELRVLAPEGEAVFRRREGEEGREWTLALDGADPTATDAGAVEGPALRTELDGRREPRRGRTSRRKAPAGPSPFAKKESEGFEEPAETGPESVRFTVLANGEAQALRTDDERTLLLTAAGWEEIARPVHRRARAGSLPPGSA